VRIYRLSKLVITCTFIQFICRALDACVELGVCQYSDCLAHIPRSCCRIDILFFDFVYIESDGT
jgi:hypothetical protein